MGVWVQPHAFKNNHGSLAQLIVLKSKREPVLNHLLLNLHGSLGLNRASNLYGSLCSTMHQWLIFQNYMIMLINHQPLEAYTCLLYHSEHGSLGIDRAVEGPVSASPWWKGLGPLHSTFSGKYGGIDLCRHHHNLVRARNLIYSCTCHGLL